MKADLLIIFTAERNDTLWLQHFTDDNGNPLAATPSPSSPARARTRNYSGETSVTITDLREGSPDGTDTLYDGGFCPVQRCDGVVGCR